MGDEFSKNYDIDLEDQMREIEAQMERRKQTETTDAKAAASTAAANPPNDKPLLMAMEGLTRAVSMQGVSLADLLKLSRAEKTPDAVSEKLDRVLESTNRLEKIDALKPGGEISWIKDTLQRLEGKDSANQKLFDALHEELKSYKDGFLFDALQKPLIRDLIVLHDELSLLSSQLQRVKTGLPDDGSGTGGELGHVVQNLSHQVDYLIEVLLRLDVEKLPPVSGKLDKKEHKAMQIEPTQVESEDQDIVSELKSGFTWRGRLLRPPEVRVRKYQPAE